MPHRSPGMLRICTKIAFAILSYMKPGSRASDIHVDDASFISSGFHCIGSAVFIESNGAAIGIERQLLLVKSMVLQSI